MDVLNQNLPVLPVCLAHMRISPSFTSHKAPKLPSVDSLQTITEKQQKPPSPLPKQTTPQKQQKRKQDTSPPAQPITRDSIPSIQKARYLWNKSHFKMSLRGLGSDAPLRERLVGVGWMGEKEKNKWFLVQNKA